MSNHPKEKRMKVTIDLSECPHVTSYIKWCSVSRTMKNAGIAIEELLPEGKVPDNAGIAMEELEILGPAMDWLHQAVRNEIWVLLNK